jgi:ubiquinone/menaquinone biosynthesis C-methylase UbiE
LAKRGPRTTGVDDSEGMLGRAAVKAAKERLYVNFVRADALMLPFPDGHFDFVLSVGALCFAKDEDKALLEMRRVLKPGGRLVVGVLNKWSPWALLRRIKGLFKKTIYAKAKFISPPELESSLVRAGFEVKTLKACLFFLPINSETYLRTAAPFEKAGRMVAPRTGAFLAASATKP